jgi:hypothetical protein
MQKKCQVCSVLPRWDRVVFIKVSLITLPANTPIGCIILAHTHYTITPRCAGMLSRLSSGPNMSMPTNMLINVTTMLAKNAVQKPEILNPGTSADTSINITALITSKKSPNVINVSGIVRIMTTGRMTALTKPNSNADISSDFLLLNEIP